MKKTISIFVVLIFLILSLFQTEVFASQSNVSSPVLKELENIEVQISKTIVNPDGEVILYIDFGTELDSYNFEIAYDEAIFEYISSEGGIATSISNKIIILSDDSAASLNVRDNIKIVFKAKSDIITSNPTEFMITASRLANTSNTVEYDDIIVPIIKNVMVEPQYKDYEFEFKYEGDIYEKEMKDIKISYSSSMGKPYERARLIAEAKTPENATVRLLGIDEYQMEHDIIQSGWGNAQGAPIGGKDIAQVLNVEGIFSKVGNYDITLKLINRENSDEIIAQETFNITVKDKSIVEEANTAVNNQVVGSNTIIGNLITNSSNQVTDKIAPTQLPKTGINAYAIMIVIMIGLLGLYVYQNRKK